MFTIKNFLVEGLTEDQLSPYINQNFNGNQLERIFFGLLNNLTKEQIDLFAHPEFNENQMQEIKTGFAEGLSTCLLYTSPSPRD